MTEQAPPEQRQKRERPRDELGRPLPWGAENRLLLEDFASLTLTENHRLGIEHFNAGRFFGAHEAWEIAWRQTRGQPDEEFFKGLSQLGAGYTHYQRGNARGARALLERGSGRVASFGPRHRAIDVQALLDAISAHVRTLEPAASGASLPVLSPPQI